MKEVWIYSITFYIVDDEYGHHDWCGTYTEVFPSKESAERFKKDWEDPKNMKTLEDKMFCGINLYNWYYKHNSFVSSIYKKEILDY